MLCSGTLNDECGCTWARPSKDSSQNASYGSTRCGRPVTFYEIFATVFSFVPLTAVVLLSPNLCSPCILLVVMNRPDRSQWFNQNLQPERLTSFEKWFSHEFAVPVPSNPGKKNTGGSAIEKVPSRPVVHKTTVSRVDEHNISLHWAW